MGAAGKKLDDVVAAPGESRPVAHGGVVVDEVHELAKRRELVGERLREPGEALLGMAPAPERLEQPRAELRVVAAQRAHEVAEQHERILVRALQR